MLCPLKALEPAQEGGDRMGSDSEGQSQEPGLRGSMTQIPVLLSPLMES